MFAPAGRITARASRLCRLAALVVRRQALAPWNPKEEGRGRAGLKNRQDTFFDAPPTRSRLTAPPITFADVGVFTRLFLFYGWFVGRGLDPSLLFCGYCKIPSAGWGHPARGFAAKQKLRVTRPKGFPLRGKLSPQVTDEGATAGHFPLIRRGVAPPSPKGGRLDAPPPFFI